MDRKTARVASEIVEAGLQELSAQEPSLERLRELFVGLGGSLAEVEIGHFARGLSSAQESEAQPLRERIATDLHREAAQIVFRGVTTGVLALRLADYTLEEAVTKLAWELRSQVAEENPADSLEDAVLHMRRAYVFAAAGLDRLAETNESKDLVDFSLELIWEINAPVVIGAASTRAIEVEAPH